MGSSDAQLDEEMSVLADDKVMALTEADVHNVSVGLLTLNLPCTLYPFLRASSFLGFSFLIRNTSSCILLASGVGRCGSADP